jgi:hypothetical protein
MMADDPRDEQLAALLDVEPLDELTRRRLVAGAMAAADHATTDADAGSAATTASRPRFTRWLAAAAAVLVVVVIGSVAVLRNGGSDNPEVASRRAPVAESTTGDSAGNEQAQSKTATPNTPSPASAGAGDASLGTPSNDTLSRLALGDFGDLSKAAARRRVLAAIDAAALPSSSASFPSSSAGDPACPNEELAPILASATGTYHGRPAEVVVTERGGTRHVLLLIANPCEVRQLR